MAERTRAQLIDYVRIRIVKDDRDPIVSVSIFNYKVIFLGEVIHPSSYTIEGKSHFI